MSRCRWLAALALAALLAAASATAATPGQEKQRVDAQIGRLRGKIAQASAQEGVLTSQLSAVTARLRQAQAAVGVEQTRLASLEARLAGARVRLSELADLVRRRAAELRFARQQDALASAILARRVREIYVVGKPDVFAFLASTRSFSGLLDDVAYLDRLGHQDERIADDAKRARLGATRARAEADQARAALAATTRELAARAAELRTTRDRLAAARDALGVAGRAKAAALGSIRESKRAYLDEVDALQAQSAALAARIKAAQSAPAPFVPPAGGTGQLQWPVSGPVTSGFGIRWGRLHPGIDIAVPSDTPVHAAAAGRVIYAGWMTGYGNIVVLDDGNGISTAYAHNTSLGVSLGQEVAAGAVIASSGSTGYSTGPHVHFEVRVNGEPVDPLRYL